ncbi:MAG: EamA family transporter [Sneathiella sp.]|jgi:drug/metabolite transporter (DMT)-like permease|uniref:DMT family transporter n=1 Tax=Sneathiella sp. TaxID=1964365 RepID=UPI000C5B9A48|nr:DMT family transporter [Sneathiella sp.]MAL79406.1 EamA family transporter [Sneathiella sp.]
MTGKSPSVSETVSLKAMPAVFVFLWSTGFIGAKLGLPYIEPLTFLAVRFILCVILMLPVVLLTRTHWPVRKRDYLHISIGGLLMHGGYLGFVFMSIAAGTSAGVSALIVGIQPLIVAALAGFLLQERVSLQKWIGLLLGLSGVFLVVFNKLAIGEGTFFGMGLSFIALISISAGTLYQKKFCSDMNIKSGNLIQFAVAAIYFTAMSFFFETREIIWSGELLFALGWLVIVLSLGAMTLLYLLLRSGAAANVSSLFYLTPPCTAIVAFVLFDEQLGTLALIGMAIAAIGVALVNYKKGGVKKV